MTMYDTIILSVCGISLVRSRKINGSEKKDTHAIKCARISMSVLFFLIMAWVRINMIPYRSGSSFVSHRRYNVERPQLPVRAYSSIA